MNDAGADASASGAGASLADAPEGTRLARVTARLLKDVYGSRLRQVILFGSWARGEADAQSDVDLLIVLDRIDGSYYREIDRIADATFELGINARRSISGIPASEQELERSGEPLFEAVRREGVRVA